VAEYGGLQFELSTRDLTALVANFHKSDVWLQEQLRDLVRRSAEQLRDLVQQLAPYDTGFMHDHVRIYFTPSGFGFEVGWSADDFLSAGLAFYPWFQEFGTRVMMAQPSLGPASDTILPLYRDAVSELVVESIALLEGTY
jgi:HK97 gp10 family phage protein